MPVTVHPPGKAARLTNRQCSQPFWTRHAGRGYVDVSTIDVGTAQQIGAAIRGAGGQYLEAPVSGSKQPAEKGQLIFLTAGELLFSLLAMLTCCVVQQ